MSSGHPPPIKGTHLRYTGIEGNDLPFLCFQCRRWFPGREQLAEWDSPRGYRCADCVAQDPKQEQ